jgi:hypothetical protein
VELVELLLPADGGADRTGKSQDDERKHQKGGGS